MSCAATLIVAVAFGCAPDRGAVRASGTIEMDEIDVSSLTGGRIVRLAVEEGDTVRAGDTLAVLARGELTADVAVQMAQEQRAAAQLRDLRAGPRRAEVAAARQEVEAAQAQAQLTEAELRRLEPLAAQGLASAADLDRARGAAASAKARRDMAQQELRLLEAGARRGQVEAATGAVEAARAQVGVARSRAEELSLVAPISGVVLLRNYELGEVLPVGLAVVTIGDPERLWVRCFVAATELPRIRRGAVVRVTVDRGAHPYTGRVVEIASQAEFTPRTALTEDERANLVFGVKVALDPTNGELKAGLPVQVHFPAVEAGGANPSRASAEGR